MKNVRLVGLVLFLNLVAGCHLLPGKAEYFQKKVKPVPVVADQPRLVEVQKQAAQFTAKKIDEAKVAAASTKADVTVQVPLAEAATVAGPLSTSLGPPAAPWADTATNLAVRVDHETAVLDKKVGTYAQKVEPLEGKKIEGTGLFQIGFFTQWALILGGIALIWAGVKAYGLVNPVVGAGTAVAERIGGKVAANAFHQVVKGGKSFLAEIKPGVAYTAEEIKKLFVTSHRQEQDSNVQDLVQRVSATA